MVAPRPVRGIWRRRRVHGSAARTNGPGGRLGRRRALPPSAQSGPPVGSSLDPAAARRTPLSDLGELPWPELAAIEDQPAPAPSVYLLPLPNPFLNSLH